MRNANILVTDAWVGLEIEKKRIFHCIKIRIISKKTPHDLGAPSKKLIALISNRLEAPWFIFKMGVGDNKRPREI
jgi:hypothetical protein